MPSNSAERGQRLETMTYEEALRDKVVVGTREKWPTACRRCARLGLDGILAETNCGSLSPHDRVMRLLELLCHEVMPRFR
jgi:hypothetical protein